LSLGVGCHAGSHWGAELDRARETILYRKRADIKYTRVVMRGRVDEIVRYVMSIPPKMREEYFIKDGDLSYGVKEIERLALEFGLSGRLN
jgi:hypothetical protein